METTTQTSLENSEMQETPGFLKNLGPEIQIISDHSDHQVISPKGEIAVMRNILFSELMTARTGQGLWSQHYSNYLID